MALSMDEERILTEIASQLGHEDPALARKLAGFARLRWRRRVRVIAAIVIAGLVMASAVAVALITVPS